MRFLVKINKLKDKEQTMVLNFFPYKFLLRLYNIEYLQITLN